METGGRLGPVGSSQYVPGRPRAVAVKCADGRLIVSLDDGREIRVPLTWFDRLASATPKELRGGKVGPGGEHLFFEQVDEVISVERLLLPPCAECLNRLWYRHGVADGVAISRRQAGHRRTA